MTQRSVTLDEPDSTLVVRRRSRAPVAVNAPSEGQVGKLEMALAALDCRLEVSVTRAA